MIFHQLPLMALSETLSTWGPVAVVILGLVGFAVVLRRLARLEAALQAQDPSRALDMIGAALTKAAE